MSIEYVKYDSIDKKKWDNCILYSQNSRIYAYSFYLDAMALNWDAIILGDYEVVMPLTWKKKFGIHYLYQPCFTQQLGIFSANPISAEIANEFILTVKRKFLFAEIFINTNNTDAEKSAANFVLPLNSTYNDISSNYKADLLKNLKHAEKFRHSYLSDEDYNAAIDTYIKENAAKHPHVKKSDYEAFRRLCKILQEKKMLTVKKVLSPNNDLQAIALLLNDQKRLYNIMSSVTAEGRKSEANHFLYDALIKEYAGSAVVLDFEGSDIDGIAFFYKKFGAVNEPYYFLRYNNLPFPLKYLKR